VFCPECGEELCHCCGECHSLGCPEYEPGDLDEEEHDEGGESEIERARR